MKIEGKEYRTIWFDEKSQTVKIIDQTKLPHQFVIKDLKTVKDAIKAIKTMEVRGAPLIGGTAAYGIVLTIMEKNILKPKMNLGDAILFNFKVLHSSSGNSENIPRRAFSIRFIGDDVKYLDRGEETSPPFKGIDLKNGEKMREDWFPVVWSN